MMAVSPELLPSPPIPPPSNLQVFFLLRVDSQDERFNLGLICATANPEVAILTPLTTP